MTLLLHLNSQNSFLFLQNNLVRRIVGMDSPTCPDKVLDLNNRYMVQFIRNHLGIGGQNDDLGLETLEPLKESLLKTLFD